MEKLCSIKGSKLYFNGEELLKGLTDTLVTC